MEEVYFQSFVASKISENNKMKIPLLDKCIDYCNRLLSTPAAIRVPSPPRRLASVSKINEVFLPPNGSLTFTDPIISNDLLYFSIRPFQLCHLSICLPTVWLHHCEDIVRLCPFLWSLTITTNLITEFETLLICCQPTTRLRFVT